MANNLAPNEQHWCLWRFIFFPMVFASWFLSLVQWLLHDFFRPGIPAIWLHSNAWKLCPCQASWRTIFLVTRSCCCNWADVKHKPVYVSIFIHRASCVGSESVWPPLLKSNVCKQGPSRKVKTSQPREKKSPLCWSPLWLLSYPPTLCIWVQPADSCTVSPKCLYRIWSTLLNAKYKWFIQ